MNQERRDTKVIGYGAGCESCLQGFEYEMLGMQGGSHVRDSRSSVVGNSVTIENGFNPGICCHSREEKTSGERGGRDESGGESV